MSKKFLSLILSALLITLPISQVSASSNKEITDANIINAISANSGIKFSNSAKLVVKKIKHTKADSSNQKAEDTVLVVVDTTANGDISETVIAPYTENNDSSNLSKVSDPQIAASAENNNGKAMKMVSGTQYKEILKKQFQKQASSGDVIPQTSTSSSLNYYFDGITFYFKINYTVIKQGSWGGNFYRPSSLYTIASGGNYSVNSIKFHCRLEGDCYKYPTPIDAEPYIPYYAYNKGGYWTNILKNYAYTYTLTGYPSGCYTYIGTGQALQSIFSMVYSGTCGPNNDYFADSYTIDN